jgi:exodeoxyribonuclease-3
VNPDIEPEFQHRVAICIVDEDGDLKRLTAKGDTVITRRVRGFHTSVSTVKDAIEAIFETKKRRLVNMRGKGGLILDTHDQILANSATPLSLLGVDIGVDIICFTLTISGKDPPHNLDPCDSEDEEWFNTNKTEILNQCQSNDWLRPDSIDKCVAEDERPTHMALMVLGRNGLLPLTWDQKPVVIRKIADNRTPEQELKSLTDSLISGSQNAKIVKTKHLVVQLARKSTKKSTPMTKVVIFVVTITGTLNKGSLRPGDYTLRDLETECRSIAEKESILVYRDGETIRTTTDIREPQPDGYRLPKRSKRAEQSNRSATRITEPPPQRGGCKNPERDLVMAVWNLNSIHSVHRKGHWWKFVNRHDIDVILLTETRQTMKEVTRKIAKFRKAMERMGFKYTIWNNGIYPNSGYGGTAILSKVPFTTEYKLGIGHPEFDREGRNIIVGIGGVTVVHSYAPPSNLTQKGQDKRRAWDEAMQQTLQALKTPDRPLMWTGDMNIVHTDLDIHPDIRLAPAVRSLPQSQWPGCTEEERTNWDNTLRSADLVDPWEILNNDLEHHERYTWYPSPNKGDRAKGQGSRIDYITVHKSMMTPSNHHPWIEDIWIDRDQFGSDHVPLFAIIRNGKSQSEQIRTRQVVAPNTDASTQPESTIGDQQKADSPQSKIDTDTTPIDKQLLATFCKPDTNINESKLAIIMSMLQDGVDTPNWDTEHLSRLLL